MCATISQTFSTRLPQNPACVQSIESSVMVMWRAMEPARARRRSAAVGAVSVPSKPTRRCVLSQNGLRRALAAAAQTIRAARVERLVLPPRHRLVQL